MTTLNDSLGGGTTDRVNLEGGGTLSAGNGNGSAGYKTPELYDINAPDQAADAFSGVGQGGDVNVGSAERNLSIAAGAALALFGLTRITRLSGLASTAAGAALIHRGVSGHCQLYKMIGHSTAEPPKSGDDPSAEPAQYERRAIHVEHVVTINKSADELYAFWRQFENLPRFMDHLKEVRNLDPEGKRSHWTAKGPMNTSVEWDAEILHDRPGELIAWRSMGNADVDNSGSVRFVKSKTDESATEVHVVIDYIPPGGQIGAWVAKLFGEEPQQQVRDDLSKFKQLLETGEIATNANGHPRA